MNQAGGPYWAFPLGRRDGRTAGSVDEVNQQLPSPFEPLDNITAKFTSKGLNLKDVVVLSGLLPPIVDKKIKDPINFFFPFFFFLKKKRLRL